MGQEVRSVLRKLKNSNEKHGIYQFNSQANLDEVNRKINQNFASEIFRGFFENTLECKNAQFLYVTDEKELDEFLKKANKFYDKMDSKIKPANASSNIEKISNEGKKSKDYSVNMEGNEIP